MRMMEGIIRIINGLQYKANVRYRIVSTYFSYVAGRNTECH